MKYQLNFFSVGHGLFVAAAWGNFNIVYDCGANDVSIIKTQVEKYVKDVLKKKEINICFISHFHEDHINGFLYLLKMDVKIEYIIIPYIPLINRISIILQLIKKYKENSEYLNDLILFIFNPINYISKYYADKVDKIVFILGFTEMTESFVKSDKNDFNKNSEIEDEKNIVLELPEEGYVKENLLEGIDIVDTSTSKLWKDSIPLIICDENKDAKCKKKTLMEIKCYNYIKLDEITMHTKEYKDFRNQVVSILGEEFFDGASERIFRENKLLKKLKEIYRKWSTQINSSSDINRTSLCIFINDKMGNIERKIKIHPLDRAYHCHNNCSLQRTEITIYKRNFFNALFTGDIDLSRKEIRKDLVQHYNLGISANRIDLYIVQHHGSYRSWADEMLAYCDKLALILFPITCRYFSINKSHPSIKVENRIKENNFFIIRI